MVFAGESLERCIAAIRAQESVLEASQVFTIHLAAMLPSHSANL